jgi:carbon storage regulator
MLVLTRKEGECIYIGKNICVCILEIKGNKIRVGVEAPPDIEVLRTPPDIEQLQKMER